MGKDAKSKGETAKNNRKLFIAAVVVLFAVIIIQLPKGSNAFSRFTEMYYTVQGSVIQLFGVSGSESKSAQKVKRNQKNPFMSLRIPDSSQNK
ncbi:hypothetical protein ACI2OX_08450 [Bacillus sp. N9]